MKNPTRELLSMYEENIRWPMIHENPEWDNIITPALVETGNLLGQERLSMKAYFSIMRVMIENIYIMGYNQGKQEVS